MKEKDSSRIGILKIVGSLFLLSGISISINQFILSLRVINLNHFTTQGELIFTNSEEFSRFFFSSVFLLFLVLYLLVTIQGLVLRRRSMWPWPDILWEQTLLYSPFLLLVFCTFFVGKAVRFLVLIPLMPLVLSLIFIVFVMFVMGIFYFSLNTVDKRNGGETNLFSLPKIHRKLMFNWKQLNMNKGLRYLCFLFLIFIPLMFSYYLVFAGKFSLFQDSFFPRICKAGRYKDLVLESTQNKGKKMVKGEKDFIDLFVKNTKCSLRGSSNTDRIKLEPTDFYQKITKGGYKVEVVSHDVNWRGRGLSVNFLSQKKDLTLVKTNGKLKGTAVFLIFKDRFVSSELEIRSLYNEADSFYGDVEICPIPAFCFGKELILCPERKWNPVKNIKFNNAYSLVFMANTNITDKNFDILIFTLNKDGKFDPSKEELLAENRCSFSNLKTRRIDINFNLKRKDHQNLSGLALVVVDSNQNYLRCRSILYETGDNYGKIPFSIPEKQNIEDRSQKTEENPMK